MTGVIILEEASGAVVFWLAVWVLVGVIKHLIHRRKEMAKVSGGTRVFLCGHGYGSIHKGDIGTLISGIFGATVISGGMNMKYVKFDLFDKPYYIADFDLRPLPVEPAFKKGEIAGLKHSSAPFEIDRIGYDEYSDCIFYLDRLNNKIKEPYLRKLPGPKFSKNHLVVLCEPGEMERWVEIKEIQHNKDGSWSYKVIGAYGPFNYYKEESEKKLKLIPENHLKLKPTCADKPWVISPCEMFDYQKSEPVKNKFSKYEFLVKMNNELPPDFRLDLTDDLETKIPLRIRKLGNAKESSTTVADQRADAITRLTADKSRMKETVDSVQKRLDFLTDTINAIHKLLCGE
jgi:hypothetical protein